MVAFGNAYAQRGYVAVSIEYRLVGDDPPTEALAQDPSNAIKGLFKVSGFPTLFVVGRNGKIRHVNVGFRKTTFALKSQLDGLLAEGAGAGPS